MVGTHNNNVATPNSVGLVTHVELFFYTKYLRIGMHFQNQGVCFDNDYTHEDNALYSMDNWITNVYITPSMQCAFSHSNYFEMLAKFFQLLHQYHTLPARHNSTQSSH